MTDVNKNIRSDEVEQALEILHNNGDAAMEEYLFPRGLNWVSLYLTEIYDWADLARIELKTLQYGTLFTNAEDVKNTEFFRKLVQYSARVIRNAAALKEVLLTHFGVDLDEENKEQSQ